MQACESQLAQASLEYGTAMREETGSPSIRHSIPICILILIIGGLFYHNMFYLPSHQRDRYVQGLTQIQLLASALASRGTRGVDLSRR